MEGCFKLAHGLHHQVDGIVYGPAIMGVDDRPDNGCGIPSQKDAFGAWPESQQVTPQAVVTRGFID
jgi:hypothetical protein